MNAPIVVMISAAVVLAIGTPLLVAKRSPGLATTVEVQECDRLWRDLEALHDEAAELRGARFRREVVDLSVNYLEFDKDQETAFVEVVDVALTQLKDARDRMIEVEQQMSSDPQAPAAVKRRREVWSQCQLAQRSASDLLLAALESTPRHRLFAEKRLLWLLRLEYGLAAN
jgi:hypothetical protein